MKRARHVMLRLTPDEYARLVGANETGDDLAVFARRTLLAALAAGDTAAAVRRAAAFTVAALSPDIDFKEALDLYDQVTASPTHTTTE